MVYTDKPSIPYLSGPDVDKNRRWPSLGVRVIGVLILSFDL